MLNRVSLMGRLVADPELRHTQTGTAVASFRIAVERDFKDKETGEKKSDFINIVAWRSTAEFVSRFFTKGRMAIVEGRLQVREYTDRDGNRRYATEVVADNIYFGDSKREGEGGYAPRGGYDAPPAGGFAPPAGGFAPPTCAGYSTATVVVQFADLTDDDGELPF